MIEHMGHMGNNTKIAIGAFFAALGLLALAGILPTMLGLFGYTLLGLALSTLAVRKHRFWTLKTLKPEIAV